jgi:hypothetical protein
LSKISLNDTVQKIQNRKVDEITTPRTVAEAVDRGVPLVMVEKITGQSSILYAIEMELAKVMKLVNIDNRLNIQPGQTETIAQAVFDYFKTESLEDFKLAFAKGAAGFYGEIYRLDGAVITRWIQLYLDEKYTFIEEKFQREKKSDFADVDYAAYIQRMSKERDTQNEKRQEEINRRKREAESVMNGEFVRKKFIVEGMEVYATSQEEAERAHKEFYKPFLKERGEQP